MIRQRRHRNGSIRAWIRGLLVAIWGLSVVARAEPLESWESLLLPPGDPARGAAEAPRAWEDLSDGTGEADFTAVAVEPATDPRLPGRLLAGANGSVYLSEDGGKTWTRVLRVRGTANDATGSRRRDTNRDTEVEDRLADRREEIVEELKRDLIDELSDELGEQLAEQLAEDLADELADERLEDEADQIAEDAGGDASRRGSQPTTGGGAFTPAGQQAAGSSTAPVGGQPPPIRVEPRRISRLRWLGNGEAIAATGSGVFRSSDGGRSWSELPVGIVPAEKDARAVCVDRVKPTTLYVGTLAGLYRSSDGGETWIESSGFPNKLTVFDIAQSPLNPMVLLAATEQGVYRSSDGGDTFVSVSQPNSPLALVTRAVAFDPVDASVAYAGTLEGLFRSTDGGDKWDRLEPIGLLVRDVQDLVALPWGLLTASSNGVFVSSDSGGTFKELYEGLDARDVRRIAAAPTPLDALVATSRGVFSYRPSAVYIERREARQRIAELVERDPTVGAVANWALDFNQARVNLKGWQTRAAWAPVAPRLTLRWGGTNPWAGLTVNGAPVGRIYNNNQAYFLPDNDRWQALAVWDLQQLMFPGAQLDSTTAFRRIERWRLSVLRRVVNTYATRRRLQLSLIQSPPDDLTTFARRVVQLQELDAVLDSLTGGAFGRAVAESSARPPLRSSSEPTPGRPSPGGRLAHRGLR